MDWVDYKKRCMHYRTPHNDVYEYIDTLLVSALKCYSRYRHMEIHGVSEELAIKQYGVFLWHIAELENLSTGIFPDRYSITGIDWGMVEDGLGITRDRKEHCINDTEFAKRVASWVRNYYPMVSAVRIFYLAMYDNISYLSKN